MGKKFLCRSCGYVYDPVVGDMLSGIQPGVDFEQLPDGWICPLCGVRKEEFVELSE